MTLMILKMIGCLALLMFGMKTMSEGLQKLTGGHLRTVLGTMTKHRLGGLLTGTAVTAAVQSSTATTVMTVSFVNAGLLTLRQAIPVIMGANIGTTATAWLMSIFGFQFNMSSVVWPFFALGIVLTYVRKNSVKSFGEFVFGFSFMFLGLTTLRENAVAMDLSHNQTIIDFFASTGGYGIWSTLLFLLLGGILTMCVQSSAAIMAITLILCSSGVLPIYQGIALVMGENIGTTVTSNLAALSASTQARRAALAHMLFNVFGVVWVLILFHPFVNMVCHFVGFDPNFVPQTQEEIAHASVRVTYALSGFHTAFNLCNVLLLIWFIKPMENLICKIIKEKDDGEDFRIKFISGGLMSTAELSLFEARKEINVFAERTLKMFRFLPDLLKMKNEEDFVKLFARIEKYEGISDRFEIEIGEYLNKVSGGRLSIESKTMLQCMQKEISEIESIGDACYNMARAINRKFHLEEDFTEEQYSRIENMMKLCDQALVQMVDVIEDKPHTKASNTMTLEFEINDYRKMLKDLNIEDINAQRYSYQIGVHYMDVVNDCEKLGDYVVNVVEAHVNHRLLGK
ncbi:Na+/Pi-cotransporter [Fibrobacter succinogenes subsp. succinogenes S85]|uniref:Na+/Pi-cotransporter n=1 Tax=Fibrobacter succinogenes (strain ATCC 19169 / S85) TaxID=59374 RepID=C9RJZ7_FIBSS|nr:Na/Pi cotransporter family protein [Fibrobacter succinogenes]ACX75730.1 Na/Pi-cotransporter II-related protein [Fibrobacter succinogenes subsp. succinogenes S85]ADL25768.1 Na+/Pi-cotransporter [Fibrobacter succinogenes subsp. succinogenes S85]